MHRFILAAAAALLMSIPVAGQQTGAPPPVRPLGPRLAVTETDSLGSVTDIRPLSDGRVLVDDFKRRQLVLYDAGLTHRVVIADTTSGTKKAYGGTLARLLSYVGDTSLFVLPSTVAMLVVAPGGTIVRIMAPPAPRDAGVIVMFPKAAFDGRGRLVYTEGDRGGINVIFTASGNALYLPSSPSAPPTAAQLAGRPAYAIRDSVAILRADPKGHSLDTAGFIGVPMVLGREFTMNPLPIYDDWAVLSDGSVAFVRGVDYHIDWINADGTRTSTPRIAHDWHRLTDSERVKVVDRANFRADSMAMARGQRSSPSAPLPARNPLTPADLPDYVPAFARDAVSADANDNLWIQLAALDSNGALSRDQPAIYDIVSRAGRLVDRVQLPPSMSLIGFGPGVVYLTVREGQGAVLAKYRIK